MNRLLLFILLFAAGCSSTTSEKRDATQANTEMIKKVFEAFNKHDWKGMLSYYADPTDFLDPSLGKDYVKQTHEQSLEKYVALESFARDINDSIVGIYASEDKVIVEFISTGTTNGQKWSLPLCDVFTIKDGKVIRDATYYDQ
jgi:ketosteroid isomerase-like protein